VPPPDALLLSNRHAAVVNPRPQIVKDLLTMQLGDVLIFQCFFGRSHRALGLRGPILSLALSI
jgi:hypothetical protein